MEESTGKKQKITQTQSICGICGDPVEAWYVKEGGRIFFEKHCDVHGVERTLVCEDAQDYLEWIETQPVNIPPLHPITWGAPEDNQCPLHCGPCQNHLQTPCCVVIDITDRCNQHCPYCFAVSAEDNDGAGEPTLPELAAKFDFLLDQGEERTFNLQLSGGEPTVRDDLPEIIDLARKKGFEYIQLNTNGRRIALEEGYAHRLRVAGASVVFLQFDGTTDEIHRILRNENLLETKRKAIEQCRKAGLPVALVPTIVKGVNDHDIGGMIDFLLDNIDIVRGIHFQPVSYFGRHPDEENRVTMFDVIHRIVEGNKGFKTDDFAAITAGHPLCCFTGSFLKDGDRIISLMTSKKKKEGASCCETVEKPDPLEVIRKDRDFVLNKWDPSQPSCGCSCVCELDEDAGSYRTKPVDDMDFDEFLAHFKRNTFTLSAMAFQDMKTLDQDRLKRCRVQVLSRDNRLIPFCAYNTLYRGEEL